MTIIATDEVFARDAARGYLMRHDDCFGRQGHSKTPRRPIVVIRSAPGRLLFSDGTIVKSESMARAEREFDEG